MKNKFILPAIIIFSANFVFAQTSTSSSTSSMDDSSTAMRRSDEKFAIEAAKGGMKEVDMGKSGESKAANPRVKNFASMMVRDHTKANEELKSIMANKKIPMPEKDNQDMHMHNMENKTGNDYDKAYMDMMVDDHKEDIDLFEKESENGNDAELRAFATKMLPVLKMHLDSAMTVYSAVK